MTSNIHVTSLVHAVIFPNKSPESTDLLNLKSSNREARNAAFMLSIPIKAGADVNAKNEDGQTPLDRAEEWDMTKNVEVLRAAGGKRGKDL